MDYLYRVREQCDGCEGQFTILDLEFTVTGGYRYCEGCKTSEFINYEDEKE